ncbi:MmoB/DmpM family protein [Schinkia sp. CFF1]
MAVNTVRYVGIDLDSSGGDVISAIIEAAKEENAGVVVDNFSTFIKLKAPNELIIKRCLVEEHLGRDWSMDELHIYMASYFGFMEEMDDEQLIIRWNNVD